MRSITSLSISVTMMTSPHDYSLGLVHDHVLRKEGRELFPPMLRDNCHWCLCVCVCGGGGGGGGRARARSVCVCARAHVCVCARGSAEYNIISV